MLYFSRFKMILIWLAVAATVILAAPNLFSASTLAQLPNWVPKRQMTLGLDLQGGSHILLRMDPNDLTKDRLETTRDQIRTLLRDAKIGYTGLAGSGRTVQVRITDP
ncbi:MAG: protein translocase subunit SecDF, partial [Mesorhizobium sp.]